MGRGTELGSPPLRLEAFLVLSNCFPTIKAESVFVLPCAGGQSRAIYPVRFKALWALKIIPEMITPRAEISQDQ